ncbi:hypothetical protein [Carboxydothermus ferrireducens]|uniref:Uncharacterized protein n=1 Tax=Carboxydothermus ferrireducens DSM 11255 TaxID=1119529 RepID=A0ABX2RBL7_9THEO|nr:hypothetical protein [Carboxydothermus ferrireducens]NYE57188.1 hypothetical protein [Carboxydothermus ferrireducens DSM 11255]
MNDIESEKNFYIKKLQDYLELINQIYSLINQNNKEIARLKYKELKNALKGDFHKYNTQREFNKISEYGKAVYYSLIMQVYANINVSTNSSLTEIKQAVIEIESELNYILSNIEK